MSLYWPLSALQNNDANFYITVTLNNETLNLTNFVPKVYQKATQNTPDGSATVYQVGSGLTWITQTLGKLKLTLPHANLTTAGAQWWRLDLTDTSGNVFTALYGPLTIKAA